MLWHSTQPQAQRGPVEQVCDVKEKELCMKEVHLSSAAAAKRRVGLVKTAPTPAFKPTELCTLLGKVKLHRSTSFLARITLFFVIRWQ